MSVPGYNYFRSDIGPFNAGHRQGVCGPITNNDQRGERFLAALCRSESVCGELNSNPPILASPYHSNYLAHLPSLSTLQGSFTCGMVSITLIMRACRFLRIVTGV